LSTFGSDDVALRTPSLSTLGPSSSVDRATAS
jgi:hypothetical protein